MFAKFMNKKDFHPGSKANIRRVWIAEQKKEAEQVKQRELKEQYVREQDKFLNRQLVSNDEKLKLGLNFMYDVPPGYNKDKEKDDTKEEEVRFEWQKNAPREAYAKNIEARDQPFGIPVRNVKCIKCGKWGHVNTDRECPLFNKSNKSEVDPSVITDVADPLKLMQDMRSEGLALKQSVMGRVFNPDDPNQQLVASDDEQEDPEAAFLASLTDKQKRKLLRKLDKLEKKEEDEAREVRKQEKKKKSRSGDRSNSSDSEDERLQDRSSRHREKRSRHPDSDEEENRKGRTYEDRSRKVDYNSMKDRERSCSGSGRDVERKRRRENRVKLGGDQPREKRRREQSLSQPGTEGQDHRRRERGADNERDYKDRKPRKRERERSSSRSDSVEERRKERKHRNNYKRKDNKEWKKKTHGERSSSGSDVNNEKYEKSGKRYFDSRDENRDVVDSHRKRSTSNQDGQDRYSTSGDDKKRRQRKGERESDSHNGHDDLTSRHRSACRKHQHKEKRKTTENF